MSDSKTRFDDINNTNYITTSQPLTGHSVTLNTGQLNGYSNLQTLGSIGTANIQRVEIPKATEEERMEAIAKKMAILQFELRQLVNSVDQLNREMNALTDVKKGPKRQLKTK